MQNDQAAMALDALERIQRTLADNLASVQSEIASVRAAMQTPTPVEPVEPAPVEPVVPAPVAKFRVEPASGVYPLRVKIINESEGDIDTNFWNLGGGAESRERDPEFTYQAAGSKNIVLVVTDKQGRKASLEVKGAVKVAAPAKEPVSADTIDVAATGEPPLLLDVKWRHTPTLTDLAAFTAASALGAATRKAFMEKFIRKEWAGKGSVGLLDDHLNNTISKTTLVMGPGNLPAYRFLRSKATALRQSDPINWRASQLGVPFRGNGGVMEAATAFHVLFDKDFSNFLDDKEKNPREFSGMFKLWWLFWGGPWNGSNVDDVSPASGGVTPENQRDFTIRAQCNSVGGVRSGNIGYNGYCYIVGRSDNPGPQDEEAEKEFGWGTQRSPAFKKGEWNEIKAYLKLNTAEGGKVQNNGILRLWLNGEMFANLTKMNIRGANDWLIQGSGPIHYWGGNNQRWEFLSPREQFIMASNFRMAG